jgi:hypothetical protein
LKIKVLGYNRLVLASHICSTDSIPWVHTRRKKGPLATTEDLSACKYKQNLIRIYTVNNVVVKGKQAAASGCRSTHRTEAKGMWAAATGCHSVHRTEAKGMRAAVSRRRTACRVEVGLCVSRQGEGGARREGGGEHRVGRCTLRGRRQELSRAVASRGGGGGCHVVARKRRKCVLAHCVTQRRWRASVYCGRKRWTVAPRRSVLTVQNHAQVHRKPTGELVPSSPRGVLPRFVNPRIRSKLLRLSI